MILTVKIYYIYILKKNFEVLQIKSNNPGAALANSMTFMDENMAQNNHGLTSMQQKVYEILQANNTASGTHRQNIFKQFPPNQRQEVK